MANDDELICEDCGAPGRRIIRYNEAMQRVPAGVVCMDCLVKRNRAEERAHPGYDAALAEYRAKRAAATKAKTGSSGEAALDPNQIDAAVQRLMQEVKRLEHPAPTPKSPRWIGRDLEREGWSRPMLVTAVAQALDDGDLVAGHFHDARGNRKDHLLPAPTGVAVRIV